MFHFYILLSLSMSVNTLSHVDLLFTTYYGKMRTEMYYFCIKFTIYKSHFLRKNDDKVLIFTQNYLDIKNNIPILL